MSGSKVISCGSKKLQEGRIIIEKGEKKACILSRGGNARRSHKTIDPWRAELIGAEYTVPRGISFGEKKENEGGKRRKREALNAYRSQKSFISAEKKKRERLPIRPKKRESYDRSGGGRGHASEGIGSIAGARQALHMNRRFT